MPATARDRDFTKLWTGQTISKFGSGIGGAALDLTAVLALGASPAQMGLLGAARLAPVVLLGLVAGAWVDRRRRQPLMIWADVGRAALLALIPLAAIAGMLRLELLFVVAPLVGVLGVVFDVAYQSYVPALVTRGRVMHANSRLATSDALAEITTPGLAGLLTQLITAPLALLCDAVSFLVSAVSVALVRTPEPPPPPRSEQTRLLTEIREGLALVARNPVLRALAGFRATREFFGNMIGTLYALYALRELGIGPVLLGVSIGVGGASNLLGTLIVERVTRRFGIGPTIMGSQLVGSVSVLTLPLAASAAAAGGPLWGFIFLALGQASDLIHPLYDVNTLSLRQATTPDHLLGRVNASMQVIEGALWPLGAVVGGVLGGLIGIQPTLFIVAAGIIASRLWLVFSPVPRLCELPTS
ncbi:MAG TPA: MFS transporter [Chloroflexota bacterium]|nr:MFS transporter [Chloroflexota bacterium]